MKESYENKENKVTVICDKTFLIKVRSLSQLRMCGYLWSILVYEKPKPWFWFRESVAKVHGLLLLWF